jgi:beta-D-xylosidase 4
MDRVNITWLEQQLDVINQLQDLGKPLTVFQMGGGQVDSSAFKSISSSCALLWGDYPGGTALLDVIFGRRPVAGRLPVTQHPAAYVDEIPMTDMSLRPGPFSPGRTYKWYEGDPVFEFGYGWHWSA